MSAEALGWHDEHQLDHRRRLRNGMMVSLALHGLLLCTLVVAPSRHTPPLPEVLSVDLVAPSMPSSVSNAPRSAPKPAPPSKAAPEPPPPPPPAIAKAPVQVLPEESPETLSKAKPEPKPKEKPQVKPEPRRPRRPAREPAPDLEDAMAGLREEVGPDEVADLLRPAVKPSEKSEDSSGAPAPRKGVVASPELIAWTEKTTRRIQSRWVTPAVFRGRGLKTSLELRLSSSGDVMGDPRVIGSSGDPLFDDNAVRAVMMVNPLPPPPRAGVTVFVFRSEGD